MGTDLAPYWLLLGRLIASVFFVWVLVFQIQVFRTEKNPRLQGLRVVLFALTLLSLLAQFLPIALDVMATLHKATVHLLLLYAYSNSISAALSAITLWLFFILVRKLDKEKP